MLRNGRLMKDNDAMKQERDQDREPEAVEDDKLTSDALGVVDPADAPDIADGLASSLQRELDQTGVPEDVNPREEF